MIPSQMLKGTLENCILKVISRKETYGYEISEELKKYGFADISEGTIYPMLLRLEKKGLINGERRSSPVGPKRKYFTITLEGIEECKQFYLSWIEMSAAIEKIFKEEEEKRE